MMKQWKRLAALSSAIVMAAATLTYFPNDTLQNIRLVLSASAETTTEPQVWNEDNLTWTLTADGTLTISGTGAMKDYNAAENLSPAYMNSNIKKVVIEKGVTSIGELAFFKCSSLTNITIPDSVTCIAYAAFHGCSSLSSITIPNSVTSIGDYAFVVCSSLTSITIPDGVTSIGYGAFSDCSSLKTISLSCKSSLKKSDFGEQANLVSYTNQHLLTKTAAKDATCSESGNKEYWTCKHCGKYFLSDDANPATATAVELSETVIPALNHKNATTRGAFEPTETEPGYSGDRYCPDCDTVLEKGYTYWKEDNLTWKLDADGTLTISGTGAMKNYKDGDQSPVFNNSNVKKVVIEDGVTSIGNYAFSYTGLKSITIPDSVTSIGNYVFSYTDLKSITIPDRVTSIGNYAFVGCKNLTSITIPGSVTSIGNGAFYHCTSLTSITIPDRVTSIGFSAFSGCKNLTSITIPDSVISIEHTAFYNCSSLKSITIPDSVTSIGDAAFKYCSNLKTISLSCKSTLKRSDFGDKADFVSYASHTLKKTAAKAKTCTEDGNKEYWTCEHCGKYFLSNDTNPETAKAVEQSETIIPASHKLTKVDAKAVTCAENGNKEYWTCEHCKKYFLSDDTNPETAKAVEQSEFIIPALNHKNATTRGVAEPTGTAPGYSGDLYCPDCDTVLEKGYTYWKEGNLTWKLDADGTLTISGTGAMKDYDYDDNPSPAYNNSKVKKVVIEKGVTTIGEYAFCNCTSLTDITIPDSVTSIEDFAFEGCISLTSITIPDGVTSIGTYAFGYCSNLISITISDSVTSIGNFAFKYCSSLTSITIPDSVTSIGGYAFSNCESLTSITIPDSVTSIGYDAFYACSSLTTISLSCGSALKKSDFGEQADLVSYALHTLKKTAAKAKTCTEDGNIEHWTCEHCKKYFLSDDTNPETAKAVEQSETIIPASHKLTKVEAKDATCAENGNKEYWTCEHCGKYFLSDDTNPKTAKAVELSETVIPASHKLTKVDAKDATCSESGNKEYWICEHCKQYFLSDDTNPETAKAVELSETILPALKHKNATTRGVAEPTETEPGYSGDLYCPDCDTVLEKGYTYWKEDNLTWKLDADGTMTISGTGAMKDYGYSANQSPAYNNLKVKKVVIEKGVTNIGNWAFSECSSLTSITIPGNVESIGESAFYSCDNLTDVTLQDGVKSIGNSAFIWCNKLTNIVLPNSITSIEGFAFKDCTSLTSITIPDGVTSIGEAVFYNCTSLTSITIPDSVTSIGRYAFENCSSLKSITIPDSVTSIRKGAFENCSSLKSITIPDSVTSIGAMAFDSCSNLKTISLSCKSSLKKSDFGEQADLVSYTNQHLLTKTEAKDATCTEDGNKEYWTCEHCGKYFLSDDANPATATAVELSETVIPASHKLTKMDAKDATCTESGNKEYWTCEHCGKYFLSDDANSETAKAVELSETVISASHKLTKVEAKDATCTENGNIEHWTCEHCKKYFLSDDTNPETAKAVEQSETVIPASHKLTKMDAKDATCTESGNKEYWTCEHCGKYFLSDDTNPETAKAVEQSETIIPASHKLTKVEAKDATCAENGNIEHWTCEHCGKYFLSDDTNPETAKAVELSEITIPPIKHSYDKNGFCKNDDTHYQPASYNEESEKYEISNAGQLYWFAEQVNSGNASLNAVLTTDIVVNETVLAADGSLGADPDTLRMWYPIGVGDDDAENIFFKGTFDGQGHTISGLYFSNDSNARDVICASLFCFSAGIIQNVGLEDSYFKHHNASTGICAINYGQIVNCYNAGTILGYGASGICAQNSNNGSIENCYNTGVIRGSWLVAGICNLNLGSMKDCYNNSDITVRTDITIIDENDEKNYASGICNNNSSSGRIENCYHVGQVSGADVNNNICNINAGQIENSYYDCNICDKDAITQNESSAVAKNVEGKTTKQFASGEVTYLLNGDQSVRAFYQNLAKEKYPTLNQKSKVVMQLEMIYDESFGEDATTNKTYHNAGDTIALETSPDKAYTYQYFVNGKQIEESNYTLTGNTKMTVKRVPVEIELSEIDTIQLTCQKKMTLDLTEYLKNFADLKPVQFQLDADSKLPEGLTLAENGILSGIPEKAAENMKTTLILTAKNGTTKNMELTFHIAKADPTVEVSVSGDSHTEGDLVSELKLILSENSTKGVVELVSEIKALVAGKNTLTWKFTPEDENNYHTVTGTVVVNAQTTTTTTTKATTTTTKATTTTKPNKTTTTKATTTTKPSKTTTTKAMTTTKPSKTTTTNATTTTKPNKTTTTKVTTTTKPSKATTTKVTTTTKPNKTTTTNVTTTTKPSKTTTTNATTTNTAIPSYGDVNLDGKVDILDAVYLNRYLATLIQFSDAQIANADCYQDGVLDDQDTTALMQFIILLIDDLPVQPTEK